MRKKNNLMSSLASQIRFRNAVVTALAAILAVVIISTAVPVDKVSANIADPTAEVQARADAWWSVLTDDQRLRVGVGTAGLETISDARKATLLDGTDSIFRTLVDGVPRDIYGVGEHLAVPGSTQSGNSAPIRGFQSVELWWRYMDCEEKNLATGTDNVATTNGEGYCRDYDALDAESLEHVNKVGMAINSLDEPGEASAKHNQNAAGWYNTMRGGGRLDVIYGAGSIGRDDSPYATITVSYSQVDDLHRTLVNDRWGYVYDEGGNDIEVWWSKLNCVQRLIVIGRSSDPNNSNDPACLNATYDGYIRDVPDDNTHTTVASSSRTLGNDLVVAAQFILGISPMPDVAGWWDALSNEERVKVIFGDPPLWYDMTDKTMHSPVTPAQKAQFEVPYSELSGGIDFGNQFGGVLGTTPLSTAIETLLSRRQGFANWCSTEMQFTNVIGPGGFGCQGDQIYAPTLVEIIVEDIWDPPRPGLEDGGDAILDGFDPPYDAVYQWWQLKDCRSKRLALAEDHHDLDDEVMDNPDTEEDEYVPAETSEYCKLYPGDPDAMGDNTQWLSYNAYRRVHEVARILRVRIEPEIVRPPFNGYPSGEVLVHGPAVVGEAMMADISGVTDPEGIPENGVMYQWLRDGTPIPGATGSSYVLTTADAGAIISVNVSYTDLAYIRETISGRAGSQISVGAVSGGGISRIEPGIRSVTVSAGDEVVLQVNIYGLQGAQDQSLGNGVMFNWMQDGNSIDGMASSLTYTAPSSPGAYRVVASLEKEDCRPADRADFETDCSAEFEVRVRRPAAPQPADEPPVNPPGEIPTILTDGGGAQYEVFTPVEGGTFDAGEGYSIMAPAGAVPNGEYIGVRMSDDGMASNAGVTSHRYTLGGNMYGIHAVDSTGASVTDYVLEDPARVCVPLPDVLRAQISDLALVTINSDNTLTILAANVRLGTSGTSVCGNLSNLPASVAVGSFGAPDAIPTATPEPTPIPPETGASSPSSNSAVWALLLGIAVLILGSFIILGRRRGRIRA